MLSRTVEYWTKTMLALPDFFATRTTIQYDEPPPKEDTWKIVTSDQSLHAIETSNTTVLYRDGKEVVDADARKGKKKSAREPGLDTQGTFGPILAVIFYGVSGAHSARSALPGRVSLSVRGTRAFELPVAGSNVST
jgi:hypothetical protein